MLQILSDNSHARITISKDIKATEPSKQTSESTTTWDLFFEPISQTDKDRYREEYRGKLIETTQISFWNSNFVYFCLFAESEMESFDIRKAHRDSNGSFNYVQQHVPFITDKDKLRIKKIAEDLDEWITYKRQHVTYKLTRKKENQHFFKLFLYLKVLIFLLLVNHASEVINLAQNWYIVQVLC